MDIYKKLYYSKIHIAENSVPKTGEYKKASRKLSEAVQAARADLESLIQILGFQLKLELAEEKTDKDDRLLEKASDE